MSEFLRTLQALSEHDFKEVEESLGFGLPPDLREHYAQANGGVPKKNVFRKGDESFRVLAFLPIKYGEPGYTLEETYRRIVQANPFFPVYLVPMAVDAFGDFYCFSRRKEDYGKIYCYRNEYFDEPERAVIYLAPNLDNFLGSLGS
jgi:hypothetical protein